MHSLVLATSNPGKINELTSLLKPIKCIPQNELQITDAVENGLSFIENALIKARNASKAASLPALADDSGLIVNALNGKPGIYSARFAQMHASKLSNIDYLLSLLENIKKEMLIFIVR